MNTQDRVRRNLQILFFGSIVFTIVGLYILNKQKAQDGVSRFFPELSVKDRIDYYPNGKIRAAGKTIGFDKDGTWVYYNENGKVVVVEVYQKGKLITTEKK
jgi:uncharacterized protein YuzE